MLRVIIGGGAVVDTFISGYSLFASREFWPDVMAIGLIAVSTAALFVAMTVAEAFQQPDVRPWAVVPNGLPNRPQ